MGFDEFHFSPSGTVQDSVIASSLITAPAWGPWLSEVNGILTTLSLLIGLTIGAHRLWRILHNTPPTPHIQNLDQAATKRPSSDE